MTIAPLSVLPVAPAAGDARNAGDGTGAGAGFGALVGEQLARLSGRSSQQGGDGGSASRSNPVPPEIDEEAAAGLAALGLLLPGAWGASGSEPTGGQQVPGPGAGPGAGTVPAPAGHPAGHPAGQPQAGTTATEPGSGPVPGVPLPTGAGVATGHPAAEAAATADPVPPAPSVQPTPVDATGAVTAPVAPETGAAEGPAPAAGPDPSPLLDQLTPVVKRMVSAGEGSHRMVLRLHPADLGEVHLTVTVRGDDVDVTVSASPDTRRLLADGSNQLRSLLESVGRTTGQVVFRDLPGSPVAPVSTTGAASPGLSLGDPGGSPAGSGGFTDPSAAGSGSDRGERGGPSGRPHATGAADHRDDPQPHRPTSQRSPAARGALDVSI